MDHLSMLARDHPRPHRAGLPPLLVPMDDLSGSLTGSDKLTRDRQARYEGSRNPETKHINQADGKSHPPADLIKWSGSAGGPQITRSRCRPQTGWMASRSPSCTKPRSVPPPPPDWHFPDKEPSGMGQKDLVGEEVGPLLGGEVLMCPRWNPSYHTHVLPLPPERRPWPFPR